MADAFGLSSKPFTSGLTRLKKQKQLSGPALKTDPSNIEKLLDVINKPGAMERQLAINLTNGDDATKGLGNILGYNENQGILSNINNVFSANDTPQPTGGDVLQALRGGEAPTTTLGKIGQGVAGFSADFINPFDPLNWIGIGEATKLGKAAEMAGKELPFVEGLLKGERSLFSLTPPLAANLIGHGGDAAFLHTPNAINNIAGHALSGIGRTAMAIPGVPRVVNAFKRPFGALATFANKAASGATNIFRSQGTRAASEIASKGLGDVTATRILKDAAAEIGEGALEKLNPSVSGYYKQQGFTPEQQAFKELNRIKDFPISTKQPESIKNPHFIGPRPPMEEALSKIPTQGRTLPTIKNLALSQIHNDASMRELAANVHLPMGNFQGAPLQLSKETKGVMEKLGVNVEHGPKKMHEFTAEQQEAMVRDPALRAKIYSDAIGTGAVTKNPHIFDALKNADPKGASFFSDDSLKAHTDRLEYGSKAISKANVLNDIFHLPEITRPNMEDWRDPITGALPDVAPVDIPDQFHGVFEKAFPGQEVMSGKDVATGEAQVAKFENHRVWVPSNSAHEFKNFLDMFSDSDKANRSFGALEASWRALNKLYKETTLLTPLGGLHTALRDHMGNHYQSWLAGGWSAKGNAIAAKLTKLLHEAGDNPKRLEKLLSKIEPELANHLRIMKESNMFEESFTHAMFGDEKFNVLQKAMGMKAISKLRQMSENFSRIQHYMTRIGQGWKPEGAIKDVKKALYDYINLSPAMRTAQNFMPWAAWSMNNIPAMAMGALRRPGKAAAFYRAKTNIESGQSIKPDERALDEYVKGDPHIRLWEDPKTGKWTYIRLKGFIPIGDLEDVTSMTKFGDFLVSSLSPYIKTPLENTFNQSLFFKTAGNQGAPVEDYPGQTGKFLGMDIGRKTINALRNVRPLNEINRFIPSNGKPTLNPFEYGLSNAGVNLVPVDINKGVEHARFSYMKQLQNLKLNKKRQEAKGQSTGEVDNLIQQLNQGAYKP